MKKISKALACIRLLAPAGLLLATAVFSTQTLAYSGYVGGGVHVNGSYAFNAENVGTKASDGSDLSPSDYEFLSDSYKTDTSGIQIKIGQYLAPSFAVEMQAIVGLGGDSFTVSNSYESTQFDAELKSAVAVFGKPMVFINESVKAYGLLGYAVVDIDITGEDSTFSNKASDAGLAYGLGVEKEMEFGVFLSAEYVSLLDGSDARYNAINIGLSMYVW